MRVLLVVPHKSRPFYFGLRAQSVPGHCQIVHALHADRDGLRAGLVVFADDVAAELRDQGHALLQFRVLFRRQPVWHQVAELPPVATIVTEHQGHGRRCAGCRHVTFGKIPAAIRGHAFGPRLAAAVVFLSSRCHGSKRTVAETVQTLFGVPIALGSVSNLEAEMAAALAPAHAEAT